MDIIEQLLAGGSVEDAIETILEQEEYKRARSKLYRQHRKELRGTVGSKERIGKVLAKEGRIKRILGALGVPTKGRKAMSAWLAHRDRLKALKAKGGK